MGDGRLADTPGFNQPSFDALTPADLPDCFPEIRAHLGRCFLVALISYIWFVSIHSERVFLRLKCCLRKEVCRHPPTRSVCKCCMLVHAHAVCA